MAAPTQRHRRKPGPAHAEPVLQATSFLPPIRPDAPLLTDSQRAQLGAIATSLQVAPRTVLYREDTAATLVFIIAEGVVKAFKDLPSGRQWVTAFLHPADVFGLAENGRYIRTAQAITHATLYQFKIDVLIETLKEDAELQFKFLCKLTHELREAQRQTIVIGRRDAVGRLAMFIRELERGHAYRIWRYRLANEPVGHRELPRSVAGVPEPREPCPRTPRRRVLPQPPQPAHRRSRAVRAPRIEAVGSRFFTLIAKATPIAVSD